MLYSQAVLHSVPELKEFVSLARYTTLQIGGPARLFAEVSTEDEVAAVAGFAKKHGMPLFVLGGGSNVLVSDSGFDGLVMRVAVRFSIRERSDGEMVLVEAGAGESWDGFVRYAVDRGFAGVECLAGIPGDVGGTPVQNVGAYGQEVSETIVRVRAYDMVAGEFVELDRAACGFGYRRSVFNSEARGQYVVTSVTYRLRPGGEPALRYADLKNHFSARLEAGEKPSLREVYDAVRSIREAKGMLAGQGGPDGRSAGSFFKNPVVPKAALDRIVATLIIPAERIPHWPEGEDMVKLPAAWLLEQARFFKGFEMGEVGISSRHTLAFINRGHATAAEMVALRNAIQRRVKAMFGIELEQEPVGLGF